MPLQQGDIEMMKMVQALAVSGIAFCGVAHASMVIADDGRVGMTILMVTGSQAPARMAGDICVIRSPPVPHADFNRGAGGPATDALVHLGASARACITGTAKPLVDEIPATTTQHRVLLGAYMRCEAGADTCSEREMKQSASILTIENRENWRAGRRIWKAWRSKV